jgi:hypothetical protein
MSQITDKAPQTCPKCGGDMNWGYIVDNALTKLVASQWASGSPQWSFWTGTKQTSEPLPIAAFRCSSCGYLESYAQPEFAAK